MLNTTQYGGSWGVDTGGLPPEDHGTRSVGAEISLYLISFSLCICWLGCHCGVAVWQNHHPPRVTSPAHCLPAHLSAACCSHMSVVDSDKMAVSLTSTVNSGFGSKVFSKSTGWFSGLRASHP